MSATVSAHEPVFAFLEINVPAWEKMIIELHMD